MAAGNGPAARIAPLAFWLDPTDTQARQTIRDVAFITHQSDEAYAAALAVLGAVRASWKGDWSGGSGLIRHILPLLPDTLVRDCLAEFSGQNPEKPLIDLATKFGSSGYAVESVPLALFAAQQVALHGFDTVLHNIVSSGGDTDTIASITGQIAGAALGYSKLPENLVARVPSLDEVKTTSTEFAEALAP